MKRVRMHRRTRAYYRALACPALKIGTRVRSVYTDFTGTVVAALAWSPAIRGRTCVKWDDSDVSCWHVPTVNLEVIKEE